MKKYAILWIKLRRMGSSCFKRAIFLEFLISAYQVRNYYNIETLFESGAELHFPQMIFIDSWQVSESWTNER